ncbi:hypothetical protein [Gordonibacter sp.]|uniref:hypothetical protein n=1 Tax=Gordonibacter sp. TaxID=1968902 RepID=UPI002FC59264
MSGIYCESFILRGARLLGQVPCSEPTFARLLGEGSVIVGLVRPHFGSRLGEIEGGVVRDGAVRERVAGKALEDAGFEVTGVVELSIIGPEGNVEYLVLAVYGGVAR